MSVIKSCPIFLFFNDDETNNPLGSPAGLAKCGSVYISIPCLHPEYQSKFDTLVQNVFKNKVIFKRIIEGCHNACDVIIPVDFV